MLQFQHIHTHMHTTHRHVHTRRRTHNACTQLNCKKRMLFNAFWINEVVMPPYPRGVGQVKNAVPPCVRVCAPGMAVSVNSLLASFILPNMLGTTVSDRTKAQGLRCVQTLVLLYHKVVERSLDRVCLAWLCIRFTGCGLLFKEAPPNVWACRDILTPPGGSFMGVMAPPDTCHFQGKLPGLDGAGAQTRPRGVLLATEGAPFLKAPPENCKKKPNGLCMLLAHISSGLSE